MSANRSVPDLALVEHASASYGPRTYHNARTADWTLAFAVDFTTAGERLTHKAAGACYTGIAIDGTAALDSARRIFSVLRANGVRRLNIAGNGLYTLTRHALSQEDANRLLLEILAPIHRHWPLAQIVSGGQTGIDHAGLVAAVALGIPAVGTYPKGFRQRLGDGRDVQADPAVLRQQIVGEATALRPVVLPP